MQIIVPKFITRAHIQQLNGRCNFIFGDNLEKKGYGGQAKVARGEPNAYGVPTKVRPCMNYDDAFFYDIDYDKIVPKIDEAIDLVPLDKPIVIFPKIGLGFSELDVRAPRIYKYLIVSLINKFGHLLVNKRDYLING